MSTTRYDAAVERVLPARLGPRFRRLLAAVWIANLADGISLAAGPLLVASQTHDPFLVALAPTLQSLPWLLFGLYAGVVADRRNRRVVLVAATLSRVAILGVLVAFIALGDVRIWVVLLVVFLFGIAETFADSTASTLTPMLVEREDLGVANARLLTGQITLHQLAGPPVGAALFAAGLVWPFVTEALCMVLAAAILSRLVLPSHGVAPGTRPSFRADIAAGLRWLWAHPAVRTLALVIVLFNITFGSSWSVLVLYSTVHLHMGKLGFGLLTTAAAVGGLVGTACYDWLERRVPLGTLMKGCLLIEVFVHLAFALADRGWMAMAVMFVFGSYAFVWGTLSQAVRQRAVPQEFQGRVGAVYMVGVYGGIVAGGLLGGLIAHRWGIVAPFWFGFVATGLLLAVLWRSLDLIAHDDGIRGESHPAG